MTNARRTLPGDPEFKTDAPTAHAQQSHTDIASIIRVNHAGEYGAKRIYQGQLDAIGDSDPETRALVEHMAEQEEHHLKYFDDQIVERRIRPTIFHPIWHWGGYAMGYITAKMGKRAAMACTVAVEDVIAGHYQDQLDALADNKAEGELRQKIAQFKAEEEEHHHTGLEHEAELAKGYSTLSTVIQGISKAAIGIAKRF